MMTPNYPASFLYRGNVSAATTPTTNSTLNYDMGGDATTATVNGVSTTITPSTSNNYAVPSQLTTNSLQSTSSWQPFLGLSSATGYNTDNESITYDANARPSSVTSPYGAVTNYTYNGNSSPPNQVATTNSHWTKTSMDGFGRTIETDAGYSSTTVSSVKNLYAPVGASPLGSLGQTSRPYAPGGTQYWTTTSYDASGRTTRVALPDGSATTYAYQGNTVTVTDPAGKSKTFTNDAFGNLVGVLEPDPSLGNVNTVYSYDVLNHLIGVSMPRGTNTQTRTFSYTNSSHVVGGFLLSATNPENGTVSYTYNSNNPGDEDQREPKSAQLSIRCL
jgi:YD repeat-containing protein